VSQKSQFTAFRATGFHRGGTAFYRAPSKIHVRELAATWPVGPSSRPDQRLAPLVIKRRRRNATWGSGNVMA